MGYIRILDLLSEKSITFHFTCRTNKIFFFFFFFFFSICFSCPANEFLRPATGLKLTATPNLAVGEPYIYRTGQIEAAKYEPYDFKDSTDLVHIACEAEFCRKADAANCNDVSTNSTYEPRHSISYERLLFRIFSVRLKTLLVSLLTTECPTKTGQTARLLIRIFAGRT